MSFRIIGQQKYLRRQPDGCGSCDACCTVLGVRELGKDTYDPCRYLIPLEVRPSQMACGGCSVYGEHPPSCKTFECLWLRGVFGLQNPHHRPDRLGLVFTLQPDEFVLGQTVTAREVTPGASDRHPGKEFLNHLRKHCLVLVMRPDGTRTLIGPADLIEQAAEKMRRRLQERGAENVSLTFRREVGF